MIRKYLILSCALFVSTGTAQPGKMTIFGTLVSYDQNKAVILTENKAKISVPKKSVTPKVEGVIVGKGEVKALVNFEELLAHNPQIKAASKKLVQKNK